MAFMRIKSCCCGCSLNFGVQLMAYFLLGLSAGALYRSITLYGGKESFEVLFIELFLIGSSVLAVYACKKNKRLCLLPLIAIVTGVFVITVILSLSLSLTVLGMNLRTMSNFGILTFMINLKPEYELAFIRYGSKPKLWNSIRPLVILTLVILIVISVILFHFLKAVCSLFAQMENPTAFRKHGTIFIIYGV